MNKINERKFDVICGMELNPAEVEHTIKYKGETYYFCSENCKDHFKKDPEKYVS